MGFNTQYIFGVWFFGEGSEILLIINLIMILDTSKSLLLWMELIKEFDEKLGCEM